MHYFSKHYLQIETKFTCIHCNLRNIYKSLFVTLTLVKYFITEMFILFKM